MPLNVLTMGERMINSLWNFFVWIFTHIPWLFIALAAAMVLAKRRKSLPILLQTIGAMGMFLIAGARWLVLWLLQLSGANIDIWRGAYAIFSFLTIVAFLIFAAGFAWEKFQQWRETPAEAPAFPVQ
jgi:hypothetical protein